METGVDGGQLYISTFRDENNDKTSVITALGKNNFENSIFKVRICKPTERFNGFVNNEVGLFFKLFFLPDIMVS